MPAEQASATTSAEPLPGSLKGYELYAWEEGDVLSFTLITGTNRQKTLEEITASSAGASTQDWVFVRGQGMEALQRLLARVPADTSVALLPLEGLGALSEATRSKIAQALDHE